MLHAEHEPAARARAHNVHAAREDAKIVDCDLRRRAAEPLKSAVNRVTSRVREDANDATGDAPHGGKAPAVARLDERARLEDHGVAYLDGFP